MIQILRELEGSAFIIGILMLLIMLGLWAMVWRMFGNSVLIVLACWVVAAFIPFILRVVTLCVSPRGSSLLDH